VFGARKSACGSAADEGADGTEHVLTSTCAEEYIPLSGSTAEPIHGCTCCSRHVWFPQQGVPHEVRSLLHDDVPHEPSAHGVQRSVGCERAAQTFLFSRLLVLGEAAIQQVSSEAVKKQLPEPSRIANNCRSLVDL